MCSYHLTNRKMIIKNQEVKNKETKPGWGNDLTVLVVISLFIGFLSPFGMTGVAWYLSVMFWFSVCFVGYLIYRPTLSLGVKALNQYIDNIWICVAICLVLASAIMAFIVPAIIMLYFDLELSISEQYFNIFSKSLVIGGVISAVSTFKSEAAKQKKMLEQAQLTKLEQEQKLEQLSNKDVDKFLQQLPVEKRGKLYCLEMSDHYVKVYTDKGHHMLLMRFKDALSLLEAHQGLQTHRSWWVALDAISKVKKESRKTTLVLENGLEVPVSRTYQAQVKTAGIF